MTRTRILPLSILLAALAGMVSAQPQALPRTPEGKPDLQGIWQVEDSTADQDLRAARGALEGGTIPWLPAAAERQKANFAERRTADPLASCYFPGVPRIMYLAHPFQIFQTAEHVAMAFAWSSVYRLIYTNGKAPLHEGFESWMGNSRGHWEGDTLVVEVTDLNDKTWFDMTGSHHSSALQVTEHYTAVDIDTIRYEATIKDAKTFSKPWKISLSLARRKNVPRLMEFMCQAEKEEASGAFERDPRTWYPGPGGTDIPNMAPGGTLPEIHATGSIPRTADGKPNLTGYYQADAGNANQGLEKHPKLEFTPATKGVIVDPPDGLLPYRPWARQEQRERAMPYRGYDDPTAHCFVAGIPRSTYVPSPHQMIQTPAYIVMLYERMSWRIVRMGGVHIPDNIRLWQGDSIGHWEGDTLVVDTANLNGKTWLNEFGDVVSHTEHVVERFTPADAGNIIYRATVHDPIVYTRPWTLEMPLKREAEELLEVACHEDNGDLQHLKDIRDEYRAKQKRGK